MSCPFGPLSSAHRSTDRVTDRKPELLHHELTFTSTLLPGGNFVAALMDRTLMRLSDRGGASGLIGDRWAAICAQQLEGWVGGYSGQAGQNGSTILVEQVIRLDDLPHLVLHASRKKLQSPDFLILGRIRGEPVIQAADAKFSVETARSRQVSPQVLADLFANLPEVKALLVDGWKDAALAPGVFLCPDYSLTAYMLRGQRGLRRVTVRSNEIALLPVVAQTFTAPLSGADLILPLYEIDNVPVDPRSSLLAGLYYFRLVRACVSCWIDENRPLLGYTERTAADLDRIRDDLLARRSGSRSAYGLVMAWQRRAERVQQDRDRVEHAAALPIPGRDLRVLIGSLCADLGDAAPSANQVRRRLGAWYRAQLLDAVGPVNPPVADLEPVLHAIRSAAAALRQTTQDEAIKIITALRDERRQAVEAGGAAPSSSPVL